MRPCWILMVIVLTLASGASAQPVVDDPQFEELVNRLRQTARYSPEAAWALAEQENALPESVDSLEKSLELTLALAPAIAMRKGFEATREDVYRLMVNALRASASMDLVPRIQAALADLSLRHGELESGLRQCMEGMKGIVPETKQSTKLLLLEQGIRLSIQLGRPHLALEMLTRVEALGGFSNPDCQATGLLLKAMAEGAAGDVQAMHSSLEQLEVEPDLFSQQEVLRQFWIQKASFALMTGRLALAEPFLQEAADIAGGLELSNTDGLYYWTRAISSSLNGKDDEAIGQWLDKAQEAFRQSGSPGSYPTLLAGLMRLRMSNANASPEKPFLEALSAYAYRDEAPFVAGYGQAARAELLARSGDFAGAYTATRKSRASLETLARELDRLQGDWTVLNAALYPQPVVQEEKSNFYVILLFLLFTLLVLVLALRIRTQRHINQHLRLSVEKAGIAEQAAEHASQLKSQFVSNISHEIKSPMSGLVGMASILDELITDPAQRKYLDTIRVCSRNLLVLMDDLLDLGRMESGRLEIEHKPFSPVEIFSYCEQLAVRTAKEKGLQLELDIDDSVPDLVLGDSTRFGQVLTNLLNNAIKFTEAGKVSLGARFEKLMGESGRMIITVSDTGIGIPAKLLNTVFEPFNQADQKKHLPEDGNGLGLAISKSLVDLMSGTIMVVSEEEMGTTFTVTIPFTEHFESPDIA